MSIHNDEIEYKRFRIIEGLLRELVENTKPANEGAKVECPNCGEAVYEEADHLHENPSIPVLREDYTCKPAQTEPAAPKGMAGVCYSIDGEQWHEPGTCPHCAEPNAPVNAGRAIRQMERMISGLGAVEPAAPVEMPVFLRSVRGLIRMAISPECYPVADTKKAAQNVWETTDALEAEWRARAAQPDPAAPVENIVLDGATATRRKRELEEAVAAPVNAGRAVRRFGRMLSGLGGGEPVAPVEMPFLRDELSRLLNHHSRENHSNTPDFVLAGFLMDALCAWERATGERDTFFGQNPRFAAMVNGPERKQPEPTAPRPLSYPIATDAEEPAASSEMPEAVRNAWKALRKEHYETFALALESWWRAHSQPAPAPVRMTEEMERLIQFAENNIENRCGEIRHEMPKVIAAVRAQAAEGVKLPKVRALLESRPRNYPNLEYDAALAELDAAERGEEK